MDVHKMLEQVKAGQLDIAEAEAKLKDLPYEDLGYAKLDHHRKLRSGFGETIFCQGKPDPYLKEIFLKFYERDGEVLGTRASQAQYELIRSLVPAAVYDPISRIVKLMKSYTTYHIWKRYPNYLRKHFWKEHTFWTDGYFACSVGNVSEEMLKKYIENQG